MNKVYLVVTAAICLLRGMTIAEPPKSETQQSMDPKMQAMMEACQNFAAIGPQHLKLAEKAGDWDVVVRFWMEPDAMPEESRATCKSSMIMDGRFLKEKLEGTVNGMPFSGLGITGYDNLKKSYVGIWLDNMGTGMMISESVGATNGKIVNYMSEMPDPMTGKYKKVRSVEKTINSRSMQMEFYDVGPDGKEFKSMEILYTRK